MDETKNNTQPKPAQPIPKGDVDDLIFRGEHWLTSDR